MNKKKMLLKVILLLIGAIFISIIIFYGVIGFKLYIGFERPDLTYKVDGEILYPYGARYPVRAAETPEGLTSDMVMYVRKL